MISLILFKKVLLLYQEGHESLKNSEKSFRIAVRDSC